MSQQLADFTFTAVAGKVYRTPLRGSMLYVKSITAAATFRFLSEAGYGNDGALDAKVSLNTNGKVRFGVRFDELEIDNTAGAADIVASVLYGDGDYQTEVPGRIGTAENLVPTDQQNGTQDPITVTAAAEVQLASANPLRKRIFIQPLDSTAGVIGIYVSNTQGRANQKGGLFVANEQTLVLETQDAIWARAETTDCDTRLAQETYNA